MFKTILELKQVKYLHISHILILSINLCKHSYQNDPY